MVERSLRVPVGADRVWEAVTEPEALLDWLGQEVTWELRPGAPARFRGGDGDRDGVVTRVEPGRALRFVWWPVGEPAAASEVRYEIEAGEEGTVLRVTERPVGPTARVGTGWGPLDGLLLGVWASGCGVLSGVR